MFPEADNLKEKSPDKGSFKKMILLAKDYVHYLRRYSKAVADGKDQDIDVKDIPKCSQLLASLKDDLRCATTIFMEDFIASGGVECLLEALRVCHARQNDSKSIRGRHQQTVLRKLSSNQYDCLLCLKYVMQNPKSVIRITDDSHGLSSIATCFMSTYPKSRILSLQLLVRVLELSGRGHALILEALTAIRVVFGEPVRFKFLVGLLQGSVASPPAFQCAALKFLNALLKTSPRAADRIRLQCELEEAGLDIEALETELKSRCVPNSDEVWTEIKTWRTTYLDMENASGGKNKLESENERLQKEIGLLRQALQKLEEDKINLMNIEMELKEKCEDLNEEVSTLKTEMKKPNGSAVSPPKKIDVSALFLDEEDDFILSGDGGQLETEEILIDVPTIRPPVGFRSENCSSYDSNSPDLSAKSSSSSDESSAKKNCFQTEKTNSSGFGSKTSNSDKESADSALSESESDSGINWSYPTIPDPPPELRHVARQGRFWRQDKDANNAPSSVKSQRSRSEDRRDSRVRKIGETKVVDASEFVVGRRGLKDPVSRQSSLPPSEAGRLARYHPGRPPVIIPSYQFPVTYRSNFLKRGHSNCDLYSGVEKMENPPPIPPPDYSRGISVATSGGTISALVHREITKAVRQISGWI